jgi:hypothetical protein
MAYTEIFFKSPQNSRAASGVPGITAIAGIIAVVGIAADAVVTKSLILLASLWLLASLLLPQYTCCCRRLAVIFMLPLLLLSALLLPGFCCCWRHWSTAVACILAVDCFPSVAGTIADDPFFLPFLLMMASLLLLS